MNESYVIVINKNSFVPVRHIVTIHEPYNQDNFAKYYYERYYKLDGDEFIYCPTRQNRDDYIRELEKYK